MVILEEETFKEFKYYPRDLKTKSNKQIFAKCDKCGKIRITSKNGYCELCFLCAQKGKYLSEEDKRKMSDARIGNKNPFYGKHHTEETKLKISNAASGTSNLRYVHIDKEVLRELYIDKNKTAVELAKILNVSDTTIANKLKEYDIPIRKYVFPLSKRELQYLYIEKHKTIKEIAKMYDITQKRISSQIDFLDFPKHDIRDIRKEQKNHFHIDISENDLKRLYTVEQKFTTEIATIFDVVHRTILNKLKMYNISTRSISEAKKGRNMGEESWNWKGGLSLLEFENAYGVAVAEWNEITKHIRERDKYICQYCGEWNSMIVHHIIPRRIGIDNSSDNLITLCNKCHPKVEHLTDLFLEKDRNSIEIFYEKWQGELRKNIK